MQILESPAAMRSWSDEQHARGLRIGLVPTMGALHAGHLALIGVARERCDVVAVSIFVNPLQFNRPDDFEHYPRSVHDDLEQCRAAGVGAVYAPTQQSMYPPGFETHVEPGALAEPLEGAGRPGHFRGVVTVVCKLFNAVGPDVAVFGQKDFQQLAVIRRMVADLDMGVEICSVSTVREHDDLALSSRNRRLSPDQRAAAVVVVRALDVIEVAISAGSRDAVELQRLAADVVAAEATARLEYVDVVDPHTLLAPTDTNALLLAVIAVWFGDVRLIDNRLIDARALTDDRANASVFDDFA